MDAIELLKKDHQKVTELFKRFNGGGGLTGMVKRVTGNVSARQRRQAADQICRELDVHALIEEEVFYPGVRSLNDDRLNSMLSEAFQEHATVKRQVAMIRNGIGRDGDLQTRMNELQACVDHHVKEEERDMFPRVELLMNAARRDELADGMQARRRQAAPAARRATATRRTRARAAKAPKRTKAAARGRARSRRAR